MINGVIKVSYELEAKVRQRRGKAVDRLVELLTKYKMGECGREMGDVTIESITEREMGER
jgi:hypothetical protein